MTTLPNSNRIFFKIGIYLLPPEQIVLLSGERNYTKAILLDGSVWVSSKTLSAYEKEAALLGFARVHKSFIINKLHIRKITKHYVLLKNHPSPVPLSRRRKNELE